MATPPQRQAYIDAALRHAEVKWLTECYVGDNGCWYASVPLLPGVWATAYERDDLADELRSVIDDWIDWHFEDGDPLPEIDGISLAPGSPANAAIRAD